MKSIVRSKFGPSEEIKKLKESGFKIIALFVSDLHLSHNAPSARADKDWYGVMKRYLLQLEFARQEAGMTVPIFVGGDIFDKWDSPAELINFAIEYLPEVWAVAGNHDLPYHDYNQLYRSAFWTLAKIGKIKLMGHGMVESFRDENNRPLLEVSGVGWGFDPLPPSYLNDGPIKMALIHNYCWKPGYGHKEAKLTDSVEQWRGKLQGYDVAVFGDNHCGFLDIGKTKPHIMNCGTFLKRRTDERLYHPMIGALDMNGIIHQIPLDCSEDVFHEERESHTFSVDNFDDLMKELKERDGALDFEDSVRRHDWSQHGEGVGAYSLGLLEGNK